MNSPYFFEQSRLHHRPLQPWFVSALADFLAPVCPPKRYNEYIIMVNCKLLQTTTIDVHGLQESSLYHCQYGFLKPEYRLHTLLVRFRLHHSR